MNQAQQAGKKGSLLLVALIFAVVGLLPLCLGIYLYNNTRIFLSTALPAEGEVISIFLASSNARTGADDLNSYAPKVAFETAGGKRVEYEATASSSDPGYKAGDKVPILYNPNHPEQAKINTFFHLWLFPTIMLGMGSLFTGIALLIGLLDIKERKG